LRSSMSPGALWVLIESTERRIVPSGELYAPSHRYDAAESAASISGSVASGLTPTLDALD
jgi:hypothetical protein